MSASTRRPNFEHPRRSSAPRRARFGGSTAPIRLEDRDDGSGDGWTTIAAPREVPFELRIRLRPIGIGRNLSSVLFAPRPLLAVNLPAVLHDPDGLLLKPERAPEDEWLEYRVRCAPPVTPTRWLRRFDWTGGLEDRERYLQLPDAPATIAWLDRYARDVVGITTVPLTVVRRIVGHFKIHFQYALTSSDFPGLRGVVDFLESKSGHCSYYAAAATLLLRVQGIPTRVATGFLADEWNEEQGCYEVTTRSGHAWIEVFIGGEWIRFDPTPSQARAHALLAAAVGEGGSLAELGQSVLGHLRDWVATGDDFYLLMFMGELKALAARASASKLLRWGLGFLLVTLVALRISRRDRSAATPREETTASYSERTLYQRLLASLRRLGFEKHRAQTLREFVRQVIRTDPERFSPLLTITDDLYRARWGGKAIGRERRGAARHFLEGLQADK